MRGKRRTSRGSKRFNRRRMSRKTALPPLVPFNRCLMNTVLRGVATKKFEVNSLLAVDFATTAIFGAYSQLISSFREVKIMKVRVWITTSFNASSSGQFVMITCPKDELDSHGKFDTLASTPGAIIRKVYQPAYGIYYPTEPSERDWFLTSSAKQLFVVLLLFKDVAKQNGVNPDPPLEFTLTWDAHVKFRGKAKGSSSSIDCRDLSNDPDFEKINID